MARVRYWAAVGLAGAACLCVSAAQPVAQTKQPAGVTIQGKAATPTPEPVAETKLLMNGLAAANLRGLGRTLRDKPTEAEAWAFARGQALLIAESGNLLMLRPPKTNGRDDWLGYSGDLRDAGDKLARAAAAKDYAKARAGLAALANVCNRCHQTFQVATRVDPFAE
ncbi:hypothetical protein : Uncharacterized protein OS=Blastopirellula marina DSM 3645 GN=DSM3645_10037 PE=4 SV=1: Cytochrom_C_2 [Gemmataceae bacterium]|nr:hypothetical protein : Uncharacterized protein OS=Blastopirellula marina DSM 3645 GN=DSM3645_10037 PE=4 SV=1: Cytochrom_C_2 [Gemmataceae bacterium]VTT99901.1 hypothetical protein : Uncharacterized protein OS=Blastopirellula marina DSM 3645 GN=DSM3645_10037 PE=4 SV=1: Cytochrom_C_2 [Gemmataceae bacterium]